MKNFFRVFILLMITVFTLIACSESSDESSSGGGVSAGTFTKQFGSVSSGVNNYPFSNVYDTKTQYLYTPVEIGASGWITKIRLRQQYTTTAKVMCRNTTIKMGHTSLTALTTTWSGSSGNVEEGKGTEQIVLDDATVRIPAAAGGSWIDIPLSTPFYYNGVDNLIVDFERCTKCSDLVETTWFNTAGRRAYDFATDNTAGVAEFDPTTAAAVTQHLPWMQFVFAGGDNKVDFASSYNSNIAPLNTNTDYHKVQMLYYADAIAGSGLITGIGLQVSVLTTEQTYTYTMKLGHSTKTDLETTWENNFDIDSAVSVANSVSLTVPAGVTAGDFIWLPIPDASFRYNGTDNLVVELTVEAASGNVPLAVHTTSNVNRLYGNPANSVADLENLYTHQIALRFYGGQVMILPDVGSGTSGQPLGSGSAGQIQSLYESALLGTGGRITNVYVRLSGISPAAASLTNYMLYMGHTTKMTYNVAATYASNMDENKTVFSGTLTVPAGLKQGDWVKIHLSSPFTYNSANNLSILFTTDAGTSGNSVSCRFDAGLLTNHSVGRSDNDVLLPDWDYDGVVDLAMDIVK